MKKLFGTMIAVSMLAGGAALAQDAAAPAKPAEGTAAAPAAPVTPAKAPSTEALKEVWDFHRTPGSGVVLGDAKLCTEVGKEADAANKYECTAEIGAEGVPAGTSIYVWQAYLVPKGDSIEDITVQLKQGDAVRETKDVKVKGTESMRARTWTGLRLAKAGDWTVTINRGGQVLKSMKVKVTK
ncbi:MAG TPA: hypothetical protein VK447_00290 [Myxococcaceae bacterium]|nr:hypothetical protein [Myxococcaceae bacterium]